jgi:hypothetical protein
VKEEIRIILGTDDKLLSFDISRLPRGAYRQSSFPLPLDNSSSFPSLLQSGRKHKEKEHILSEFGDLGESDNKIPI